MERNTVQYGAECVLTLLSSDSRAIQSTIAAIAPFDRNQLLFASHHIRSHHTIHASLESRRFGRLRPFLQVTRRLLLYYWG
jgi:hypothetical protein